MASYPLNVLQGAAVQVMGHPSAQSLCCFHILLRAKADACYERTGPLTWLQPHPFAPPIVSSVHLSHWAEWHRPICCFSVSSGTRPALAFLLAVVALQNFLLPDVTSSSDIKFIFIRCHLLTSSFLATPSKITALHPPTSAPAPYFTLHPSFLLHFSLQYHLRTQIFYLFIICFPQ